MCFVRQSWYNFFLLLFSGSIAFVLLLINATINQDKIKSYQQHFGAKFLWSEIYHSQGPFPRSDWLEGADDGSSKLYYYYLPKIRFSKCNLRIWRAQHTRSQWRLRNTYNTYGLDMQKIECTTRNRCRSFVNLFFASFIWREPVCYCVVFLSVCLMCVYSVQYSIPTNSTPFDESTLDFSNLSLHSAYMYCNRYKFSNFLTEFFFWICILLLNSCVYSRYHIYSMIHFYCRFRTMFGIA